MPDSKLPPSQRLRRFLLGSKGKKLTMGGLVTGLGNRSIGILLMLLAVPTFLQPPGFPFAAVMSVGTALIGLQMLLGRREVVLPSQVASRELPGKFGRKFLVLGFRAFRWIEKHMSPRMAHLFTHNMHKFLGVVILILSTIIFLPIPGGNIVPGIAVFVMGAGLAIGDGVAVIVSIIFSLLALAATIALVLGGKELIAYLYSMISG
jgi:hypothetical protein